MNNTKIRMRVAGLFYLTFILFSFAADYTASFALTDIETVIHRLTGNDLVFRIGVGFNLLSALFFLLSAWGLYTLLKEFGESLALLLLILNAVGVAIQSLSCILLLSAGSLINDSGFAVLLSGIDIEILQRYLITIYDSTFMIAQLFFSTWLLPLGILVYRSKILPRILGILLVFDFVGILFWFIQHLLAPEARVLSYPSLIISLAAELGLALMLLFYRSRTEPERRLK